MVEKWTRLFKEEVSVRQGVERDVLALREELKTVETKCVDSRGALRV